MSELIGNFTKYRIIMVVIISILVLIFGTIITYKILDSNVENIDAAIVLNDGALAINYIDGDVVAIKDKKEYEYNVSITNTSVDKMYYSLNIVDILNDDDMSVEVYDESGLEIFNTKSLSKNFQLLNLIRLDASQTARYKVVFKQSKKNKFSCRLFVVNESLTTQTFADMILLKNDVSLAKTNVGEQIATLKEGLISTEDNFGTTYYFRGDVSNNYVKIADSYFRIVRINGNGTVRLVLDDVISTKFKYNVNDATDGISANLANMWNSSIVNDLNLWLENNFSEYSASIAQDNFCTDLTFDNHSNGLYYSSTYTRIFYNEPTLKCTGNIYNGKVGLLSIDEVMFAGATRGESNKSFYLYNKNINENYLTNSSYYINNSNEVFMMDVSSTGKLGNGVVVTGEVFVRPVINLSASAKVKGSGTYDNPYILVA
ncbi:MAG: hypothetical protein IJ475_01875 [Bacilli bacterium]|nr:hypothetical protein [Bacilli bacterium]